MVCRILVKSAWRNMPGAFVVSCRRAGRKIWKRCCAGPLLRTSIGWPMGWNRSSVALTGTLVEAIGCAARIWFYRGP